MHITDYCECAQSFLCVRAATTNPKYVPNILSTPQILLFTDNGDGTYKQSFIVNLNGYASMSVMLAKQGGMFGEYFDNIWFSGAPSLTQKNATINFNWGYGLITPNAADYCAVRWIGKLHFPTSEAYTLYISADELVRLYIDRVLVIDRWYYSSGELTTSLTVTAGTFKDIMIEYAEYEGTASISFSWSSQSISKDIVPSKYLYSLEYVGTSPYTLSISQGSTVASTSTATVPSQVYAGISSTILMQSRNYIGSLQDNSSDIYSLILSGPGVTNSGRIAFTSSYIGSSLHSASFIPIIKGTYTLTITLLGLAISGSPFTVNVLPGITEAKNCKTSLTAPLSITAGSTLFFSITSYDIYNNLITTGGSKSISIFATYQNANAFISTISVADLINWQTIYGKDISGTYLDNNDGTYTAQITIFKAASFQLGVTMNSTDVTSSPYALTVTPSTLYGKTSLLQTIPTTKTAGVLLTILVQGRDYYSNNMVTAMGITSNSYIILSQNTVEKYRITLADYAGYLGSYKAVIAFDIAGIYNMSTIVNGIEAGNSPSILTISPSSTIDPTKTFISGNSTIYVAGSTIKLNITAVDSYGNKCDATSTGTFIGSLFDGITNTTLSVTRLTGGIYSVSTLITVKGTYTITITITTQNVIGSPVGFTVNAAAAYGPTSKFIVSPTTLNAGTEYKYRIQALDIYNNIILRDGELYRLSLKNTLTKALTNYTTFFNFDAYETVMTITTSGAYSLVIRAAIKGGLLATYYKTIDYLSPVETYTTNSHADEKIAYTRVDPTINYVFAYGTPLDSTFPSQYYSIIWNGDIIPNVTGTYKLTLLSDSTAFLYLDYALALATPSTYSKPSEFSFYYDFVAYKRYSFMLKYAHTTGNSTIVLYWESDLMAKQTISPDYFYYSLGSSISPTALTVLPLVTYISSCVVDSSYAITIVGVSNSFYIYSRDIYSNLQVHQNDLYTITIVNTDGTNDGISSSIAPVSPGTYKVTYSITKVGTYNMSISILINGVGNALGLLGNPYIIKASYTLIDPSKTTIASVLSGIAGVQGSTLIITKDSQGNAMSVGGSILTPSGNSSSAVLGSESLQVIDNANGSYTLYYLINTANTYTIKIVTNGDSRTTSTTLTISSADPSSDTSTITGSAYATIGSEETLSIYLKDKFSNVIIIEYQMYARVDYNGGFLLPIVNKADLTLGKYTAKYTLPFSATCGSITVNVFILTTGVKSSYYSNIWLSGSPYATKNVTNINMDYGYGNIYNISDYTSVLFEGYIAFPTAEDYTFYIKSNDGIRFNLNSQQLIIAFNDVADQELQLTQSSTFTAEALKYYPFTIEYYDKTGTAYLSLEWSSATTTKAIVPTSKYFMKAFANPITYTYTAKEIPSAVLSLSQDMSVLSLTSLKFNWLAPSDIGCSAISTYTVQRLISGSYTTLGTTTSLYYSISSLLAAVSYTFRVIPSNSIGSGATTDITLTPCVLPFAPQNLAESSHTSTSITLGWSLPVNTGYGNTTLSIQYYSIEMIVNSAYVQVGTSSSLSFTMPLLNIGQAYTFRVRAANFLGLGDYSSAVTSTPKRVPLKPPTIIRLSSSTSSSMTLAYDAVSDFGGASLLYYNIYIASGLNANYGNAISNALLTSYTLNSITKGTIYLFKYTAVNSEGESQTSDPATITYSYVPSPPLNLQRVLTDVSIYASEVYLTWGTPTDNGGSTITGYKVYLNDSIYYDGRSDSTFTSIILTGLTLGNTYKISVSAVSSTGESSNATLITKSATLSSQIVNVRLVSSSSTSIRIAWDIPTCDGDVVTGYSVKYDSGPSTAFNTPVSTATNSYTYTVGSPNNMFYKFVIAGINSVGMGSYSIVKTFAAVEVPGAPATATVTALSQSKLQIQWTAPTAASITCPFAGYRVFTQEANDQYSILSYDGSSASIVFSTQIDTLVGHTYYVYVQAKNCFYYGANYTVTAISATPPSQPLNVAVVYTNSTASYITWKPPLSNGGVAINGYYVYINSVKSSSLITNMYFTAMLLTPGVKYTYEVTAVNAAGESAKSVSFQYTQAIAPGIPVLESNISTSKSIYVKWSSPADNGGTSIIGYNIYIDDGYSGPSHLEFNGSNYPSVQSKTIINLIPGAKYTVQITALNSAGEGAPLILALYAGSVPSSPYNLMVQRISYGSQITLSWSIPIDLGALPLEKYVLKRNTNDIAEIDGSLLSAADDVSSLAIGAQVVYSIKAKNYAGYSPYSQSVIATIGKVPNAPTNLKIYSRISNSTVILTWEKEIDIANNFVTLGYRIYSDSIALFDSTSSGIQLMATLNNLTVGRQYTLTVVAVNKLGESDQSVPLIMSAGTLPAQMSIPYLISSTLTSVTFGWDEIINNGGVSVSSFIVYYDIGITGTYVKETVAFIVKSKLLTGLNNGQAVSAKVSSFSPVGEGSTSDPIIFYAALKPPQPLPPSIASTYLYNDTAICFELTWAVASNGGTPITGYILYKSDFTLNDSYTVEYDGSGRPDILSYSSCKLMMGKPYRFKMLSINGVGKSDLSNPLESLAGYASTPPINVALDSSVEGSISVKWEQPLNNRGSLITGYYIYYMYDGINWNKTNIISQASLLVALSNLNPQTNYIIQITAFNGFGESNKSLPLSAYSSAPPKPPTSLTVSTNYIDGVELTWSGATSNIPITGYVIRRNYGDGSAVNITSYDGRNFPSITKVNITSLPTGKIIQFSIIAINNAGNSTALTLNVNIGMVPSQASLPVLLSSSETTISFKWTPCSLINGWPITNYKLYSNGLLSNTFDPSVLTNTLTGVTGGAAYNIQVSCVNAIGEGLKSYSLYFYAMQLPSAPTISLSALASSYCTINWNLVTPPISSAITGYAIEYDNSTNSEFSMIYNGTQLPSGIIANITSLTAYRSYRFRGYSMNSAGRSSYSNIIICFTSDLPGPPLNLKRTASTTTTVSLQWDSPSISGGAPVIGYQLLMDSDVSLSEEWVEQYKGSNNIFTAIGLSIDNYYRFKVRAYNSFNSGPYSTIVEYRANSIPPDITSVVIDNGKTWFRANWTRVSTTVQLLGYKFCFDKCLGLTTYTCFTISNPDIYSYTVANLSEGLKCYMKIYVNADTGLSSGYSSSVTLVTPPSKPLAFTLLTSTFTNSFAQVTLSWMAPTDSGASTIIGYKVYQIDSNSTIVKYDGSSQPYSVSCNVSALTPGLAYTFFVTALNSYLESNPSDSITFTAGGRSKAPSNLREDITQRTNYTATLLWDAPADYGGSALLFYVIAFDNSTIIGTSVSTTYIIPNLTAGRYGLKVCGVNKVGYGDYTSFLYISFYTVPSPPRNLYSSSITKTSITLKWTVPLSDGGNLIISYQIYRKLSTDSVYTSLSTVSYSVDTYVDNTVIAYLNYYYYVIAINSNGNSAPSNNVSAIPIIKPTGISAPTLLSKTKYSLTLLCANPSDNGGSSILLYNIYCRKNIDLTPIMMYSGKSNFATILPLVAGTVYYCKCSSTNLAGESALSAESDSFIPSVIASQVASFTFTTRTASLIRIKWEAPADNGGSSVTGYNLQRSTNQFEFTSISTAAMLASPSTITMDDTNIVNGTVYYYRICAITSEGYGIYNTPVRAISAENPSAPTSLSISQMTLSSVTISFTGSATNGGSPVTGYIVMLDKGTGSFQYYSTITTATALISGLTSGNTYSVKIAGKNLVYDIGDSFPQDLLYSSEFTFLLALTPSFPTNIRLSPILSRTGLTIVWDPPITLGGLPLKNYELSLSSQATVTTTLSSYSYTSLTPGQPYTFTIKTVTAVGPSSSSPAITFYAGLTPTKVKSLQFTLVAKTSATIAWLAPDDTGGNLANVISLASYSIEYKASTDALYTVISVLPSVLTYTLTLNEAVTYYAQVRAVTLVGYGDYSDKLQIYTGSLPTQITTLEISSQSNIAISLSYKCTDPTAVDYDISITNNGITTIKYSITKSQYTFTTSDGLVASNTYVIAVRPNSAYTKFYSLSQSWSNLVTAYSSILPNPITTITASSITSSGATISWVLLSTAADKGYSSTDIAYVLEQSFNSQVSFAQIFTTTTQSSYSTSGMITGYPYYYRLKVVNCIGSSAYSSVITIIYTGTPKTPASLTLVTRTSSSIALSWVYPANVAGSTPVACKILKTPDNKETEWAYQVAYTTMTFDSLTQGTQYGFSIACSNTNGYSAYSTVLNVYAATIPSQITTLSMTSMSPSGIVIVNWSAPSNGGSPITNYYVQINNGQNSAYKDPIVVSSGVISNTFSGLLKGAQYNIRVAASNIVYQQNNIEGLSLLYSSALTVLIADVPDKMNTLSYSTTSTSIILSWVAPTYNNAAISGYHLYRSLILLGPYSNIFNGLAYTYTDLDITKGNTYYYKISATNAIGDSTMSNSITVLAAVIPGVPMNLRKASQYSNSISIQWDPPADNGGSAITNYIVTYLDIASSAATASVTDTTYTLTVPAAKAGKLFAFNVAAQNTMGLGNPTANIQIIASAVPKTPVLTVTAQTRTTIQFRMDPYSANDTLPISLFTLYSNNGITGQATAIVTSVSVEASTYLASNLITGSTYLYELTATNLVGESGKFSISVLAAAVPSAITSLSISATTRTSITISWTDSDDGGSPVTKYYIWIDNGAGVYTSSVEYSIVSNKVYTFSGLNTGSSYKIKMQSYNLQGTSSFSNEAIGVAAVAPTAPVLTISATTKTSITLQWVAQDNGGSPVTKYTLSRSSDVIYSPLATLANTDTTYTAASLTTGTLYYFYITATNAAATSSQSVAVSSYSAVSPTIPGTPYKMSTNSTSITVGWTAISDNGGSLLMTYELYADSGSGFVLVVETAPTAASYLHTGLVGGAQITYKIRAKTQFGYSAYSATNILTVNA